MKYRLAIFALLSTLGLSAQQIYFPLKASADRKYLVDQKNTPVFLNGVSAWRLPYALTLEAATAFLKDRKARKFNTVLIQVTPDVDEFNNRLEKLPLGVDAFEDNDVNKPNENYFRHLDSLMQVCSDMNMTVMVAPLYLGCCKDGWLEIIQQYQNSSEKCRQYGQWFAKRYSKFSNIIWVSGGDHNPVPESIAFAEGIASVDTSHLHTFHAHPGKTSGERFQGAKWHTLSAAYTYFPAMEKDTAWQYKQVYTLFYEEGYNNYKMPCFMIESAYEDERFSTPQTIRRQAYWALLSGGSGALFGQKDIWQMRDKKYIAALKKPGSESITIFQNFAESISWFRMRPDWAHTLFFSGRGTFNSTIYPGGEDYATGAYALDSTEAALYLPSYRKVGVNLSRFKKPVSVKWFDPSSGKYLDVSGILPNKHVRYFTPPSATNQQGFDDWVLVIRVVK